jgi:hypothetical protein
MGQLAQGISKKKAASERGFLGWPGRELNGRHEDFQTAKDTSENRAHLHKMTSSDVVTRLDAVE